MGIEFSFKLVIDLLAITMLRNFITFDISLFRFRFVGSPIQTISLFLAVSSVITAAFSLSALHLRAKSPTT